MSLAYARTGLPAGWRVSSRRSARRVSAVALRRSGRGRRARWLGRGGPSLTVRTWSATANAEGAGNYSRYFTGVLLPELRKLPGFEGAYLLHRDLRDDGTAELTAHTFWESPEAVRAFAGDDISVSVVEPEAQAMLLDFDRTATHRSVVGDARE